MEFFTWSIFSKGIIPFLLVFVLVFAILQKSKLLGEGKSQIDALISLAIALMLIVTPPARDFIVKIIPFLAIGLAVMLCFLIMYAFVAGKDWYNKWMLWVFGVLAGLLFIGAIIWASGIYSYVSSSNNLSTTITYILLIIIIGGAFAVAVSSSKKDKDN